MEFKEKFEKINIFINSLNEIKRRIIDFIKYKNKPFKEYKNFWKHTQKCKTQEEYTKLHEKAIKEGIEVLEKIIKEGIK